MIKVIISNNIYKLMQKNRSLLNRQDIRVFSTDSNDETLKIHLAEHVNLIVADLDMPGMANELLYPMIRKNTELQRVAILIVSPNNNDSIEQCSRCMPDSIIVRPVNHSLILAKAQHLLDLSVRESSRVWVSLNGKATVQGDPVATALIYSTTNISSTGVLLETEKILNHGDQAVCSFILPDGTQIEVVGEIVRSVYHAPRSVANQYGLKFLNFTAEARQVLEKFLKSHAQSQ